jgi:hypothetical protein
MARPDRDRLKGWIEVDETHVGGMEEGVAGRGTECIAKSSTSVLGLAVGRRGDSWPEGLVSCFFFLAQAPIFPKVGSGQFRLRPPDEEKGRFPNVALVAYNQLCWSHNIPL